MRSFCLVVFLFLSFPVFAQSDHRIRTVTYTDQRAITIYAGQGISTLVLFGEDEEISTITAGDTQSWSIVPNKQMTAIAIKPLLGTAETNINVMTNRRIYSLLLVSSTVPEHRAVFQVRFKYPDNINSAHVRRQAERSAANPNIKNFNWKHANYDYFYSGDNSLKPRSAFDDGTKTFIEAIGEVPAVFVVGSDGRESLVNFRMEGRFMVIDKIARQFTLRSGSRALCLYNRRVSKGSDPVAENYAPLPAQTNRTKWW